MRIEIYFLQFGTSNRYDARILARGEKGKQLLAIMARIEPVYGRHILSSLLRSFADEIEKREVA